jgi:hypothetical protein
MLFSCCELVAQVNAGWFCTMGFSPRRGLHIGRTGDLWREIAITALNARSRLVKRL